MKRGVATQLLIIFIAGVLGACYTMNSYTEAKFFNKAEFAGLKSLGDGYSTAALDYSLDSQSGGEIEFHTCADVKNTSEGDVASDQFDLLQLLRLNCESARYYQTAPSQSQSYWPATLNQELIRNLPATAVPDLDGDSLSKRKGTLEQVDPNLAIISINALSAQVVLSGDLDVTYVIMARGDFDKDGIEDILMRLDWHVTTAFGKGFDLLMLSKTGKKGPSTIQWRWRASPKDA